MLSVHRKKAPRRKLRGKARYFRGVLRRASSLQLEIGPMSWWDYWHYHADRRGWSNRCWRYRFEHIRALCAVYRVISSARDRFTTPFQTWIFLDDDDASADATFLHTPNGNGSPFPYHPLDVTWGVPDLDAAFRGLLPGLDLVIGRGQSIDLDEDGQTQRPHWIIWSRDCGAPLTQE
jgi:hypothetical protein